MNEQLQWFHLLFEMVRGWLHSLLHPVETINQLLRDMSGKVSFTPIARLWTPALLFAFIINLPLWHWYGIAWDDFGFQLPYLLIVFVIQVLGAYCMHLSFRLFRLRSDLHSTVAMYTVVIIYNPLATVCTLPATWRYFYFMQAAKHANLDLGGTIVKILNDSLSAAAKDPVINIYLVPLYLAMTMVFLSVAAFCECTMQRYGNPRRETYYAVSLAMGLMFLFNVFAATPLQAVTVYSFLK